MKAKILIMHLYILTIYWNEYWNLEILTIFKPFKTLETTSVFILNFEKTFTSYEKANTNTSSHIHISHHHLVELYTPCQVTIVSS
jgi:hypothetical protein